MSNSSMLDIGLQQHQYWDMGDHNDIIDHNSISIGTNIIDDITVTTTTNNNNNTYSNSSTGDLFNYELYDAQQQHNHHYHDRDDDFISNMVTSSHTGSSSSSYHDNNDTSSSNNTAGIGNVDIGTTSNGVDGLFDTSEYIRV